MVRSISKVTFGLTLAAAFVMGDAVAFAQKKGGGGSGGGSTAAYNIIDLPGPYHGADGNWSYTYAQKISDPDPDSGTTYVIGWYRSSDDQRLPCLWVVDRDRNVAAVDLSGWFDGNEVQDVNFAGVVAGTVDHKPALLLPDSGVLILPTPVGPYGPVSGSVGGISNPLPANDPDNPGAPDVVHVAGRVGRVDLGSPSSTLWTVSVNGASVSSVPLRDSTGRDFWPYDVNDSVVMAGLTPGASPSDPSLPAIAAFATPTDPEAAPELVINLLDHPDPQNLPHLYDLKLSRAGDVVGQSAVMGTGGGQVPHAIVWPSGLPGFDLSAETGISSTQGNGIASVLGVMQVVGRAETSAGAFAYLFAQGRLSNLNPMSKGSQAWKLWHGEGVNHAGWICGFGEVGSRKTTQQHGFLLIPNPQ